MYIREFVETLYDQVVHPILPSLIFFFSESVMIRVLADSLEQKGVAQPFLRRTDAPNRTKPDLRIEMFCKISMKRALYDSRPLGQSSVFIL